MDGWMTVYLAQVNMRERGWWCCGIRLVYFYHFRGITGWLRSQPHGPFEIPIQDGWGLGNCATIPCCNVTVQRLLLQAQS